MTSIISSLGIGLALAALALPGSPQAQSRSGTRTIGSCPDATVNEARNMAFRQVPIKMPQFVKRGELTAVGTESVVTAHVTPAFNEMDNNFKNFSQQIPNIPNIVTPKQDTDFLLESKSDTRIQPSSPMFAFCYSFDAVNWSFTPGVEIVGGANASALDGQAMLTIPEQTYAVFEYDGPRADIANFRYSLTSRFWPVSSVRRVESPNFEVHPNGDDGASEEVSMQLWVAVDPSTIPAGSDVTNY